MVICNHLLQCSRHHEVVHRHIKLGEMSLLVKSALLFLLGAQTVYSTALDDYVWKPDSNYGWVDMVR